MAKGAVKERDPKAACECGTCQACKDREAAEAASASAYGAVMRPGAKKESRFRILTSLREAVVDREKREIRCDVLEEGLGNKRDKHFYGREAVQTLAEVLRGDQSYIDHPSAREQYDRPERSVWDLAGYWKDPEVTESAQGKLVCRATLVCDNSPAGDEALAKAEAAIRYAQELPDLMEVYAGISINGDGDVEPRTITIDGEEVEVNYVTAITEAGADVVTKPARAGKFLSLLESVQNEPDRKLKEATVKKALQEARAKIADALAKVKEGKLDPEKALALVEAENKKIRALEAAAAKKPAGDAGETTAEAEAAGGEHEEEEEADKPAEEEGEEAMTAGAGEDDKGGDAEPDADDAAPAAPKGKGGATTKIHIKHEERMTKSEAAIVRRANELIEGVVKQLNEAKATIARLQKKVTEGEVKALIDEKGLTEAQARALVKVDPKTRELFEATGFGDGATFGGTTPRGGGSFRESKPGEAFMNLIGPGDTPARA